MTKEAFSEIGVLAYNVASGFGDDRREELLGFLGHVRPNVAFFSEAYREGQDIEEVRVALTDLGYQATRWLYEDADNRRDRYGFIGISSGEQTPRAHRFGTRNGMYVDLEGVRVYGVHLDDRSEEGRLAQIKGGLPDFLRRAVWMGDGNAVHEDAPWAGSMCKLNRLAEWLPAVEPPLDRPLYARFGSLAQRVTRMASGETMAELERRGLIDADPERQPTGGWGPLRVQLDHIMATKDLNVTDFRVHQDVDNLSDHRPISARIALSGLGQ